MSPPGSVAPSTHLQPTAFVGLRLLVEHVDMLVEHYITTYKIQSTIQTAFGPMNACHSLKRKRFFVDGATYADRTKCIRFFMAPFAVRQLAPSLQQNSAHSSNGSISQTRTRVAKKRAAHESWAYEKLEAVIPLDL